MTAKLTIEYDGADFAGWAAQPGQRTVQGELERVLATVLRARHCAGGRGSHRLRRARLGPGRALRRRAGAACGSLNALLPPDVAVLASERRP